MTTTRRFEPAAALSMVQSFHRELEIGPLLDQMFAQVMAISPATHLAYQNPDHNVDFTTGEPGPHSISYNLQLGTTGISGGEVRLTAPRRFTTGDLETLEELLRLAAPALANALVVHELTARDRAKKAGKVKADQEDALILIRLSGIETIRTAHGTVTAQALTDQLQKQLGDKLREADGIFQIDDDHLAVLLPRTTMTGAQRVGHKVEAIVKTLHFADPALREHISATIGISTTNGASSAEAVLKEARTALSEATEHQSRNLLIH